MKVYDLILQRENYFMGWKCWAGIDGVNIDMWGNLYRADCLIWWCIRQSERYKLPTKEIVCGKSVCSCLSDIYIRKENENTCNWQSQTIRVCAKVYMKHTIHNFVEFIGLFE